MWMRLNRIIVFLMVVIWNTPAFSVESNPVVQYQKLYQKSPMGVYSQGEWLLVVAEVPMNSDKQPKIYYEAKAMLQTQQLLNQFVLLQADLSGLKLHGFNGRLALDFDELVASGDFYHFSINNISVRLLDNKAYKSQYRRVTALKESALSSARLELFKTLNNSFIIQKLLSHARNNNALLARYYFDLGLLREAYFYKWQQLKSTYYLVNYPILDKTPFQRRQYLRRIFTTDSKDYQLDWLKQLPANAELFAQIQADIGNMDRLGQGLLDWLLAATLPMQDYEQQLDKVIQRLEPLAPNAQVKAEFVFLKKNRISKLVLDTYPSILQDILNQQGFLILDTKYSDENTAYFEQAVSLFNQGRKVDKVLTLLIQSLVESPRHIKSWVYLGAVLKYKKHYIESLAAFQQASLLNHSDPDNQANIAEIYFELKQPELAEAYLYYLQQQPVKNLSAYTKKVMSHLVNIKDKK